MKKFSKTTLFLIAYFLISLFVYRNILVSEGFIGMKDDWTMPPFSGQYIGQAKKMLYSWSSNFTGVNYIRSFGDYPYLFFSFLVSVFGIAGPLLTKGILVLTLTLSGFTCFLLLRSFGIRMAGAFLGSLLYMLSPMYYNAAVSGYFVFLISYSLLPLFFLLFRQIIDSKGVNIPKILFAGLVFRLIIGQDNFLFISAILLGLFYVFEVIIKKKSLTIIIGDLKRISYVILVGIVLALAPIMNVLRSYFELSELVSKGLTSWNVGMAPKFFYSFFLDGAGYKYFLLSIPRDAFFVWIFFGTLVLSFIFSSLLFLKKDKYLIFFSLLSLIFLFLFKGDNAPFGFLYRSIFKYLPIMRAAFRNIQYFTVFVSLGYSYMFGRFLDEILTKLKLKGTSQLPVVIQVALVVGVFNLPFMTGNFSNQIQTVKLNPVYESLLRKIEEVPDDSRIMWLPISQPMSYRKTIHPGLDPLPVGSSKGFVANDGVGVLDRALSEEIYITRNPSSLANVFAMLNIGTVIYRDDFYSHHPDFMTPSFWGAYNYLWNNKTLKGNLESSRFLRFVEERDPVKIYENTFFAPHLHVSKEVVGISGEPIESIYAYEVGNYGPYTSYKFISEENTEVDFSDIYYFPETISGSLPQMLYSNNDYATSDLWPWPYCSISPSDVLYKLVGIKEKILSFGKKTKEEKIENKIWFATKRVCEIDTYGEDLTSSEGGLLLEEFLSGFIDSLSMLQDLKQEPFKDYIDISRKVLFLYEKSLSIISSQFPELMRRSDIKDLYWDLYSLALAEAEDLGGKSILYNYSFPVEFVGKYEVYSDIKSNHTIEIFGEDGSRLGSLDATPPAQGSTWNRIYNNFLVGKSNVYTVRITTERGLNEADTGVSSTIESMARRDIIPIATVNNWAPRTDYLLFFDYSFGTGDFKVIFEEEVPKVGYYRYGDGRFDWFNLDLSDIYWQRFSILHREFRNSLNFDKEVLQELGACVYWKDDICYRRFSALIHTSSVTKNPLLYVRGISETEKEDLSDLRIENVSIVKVAQPNVFLKTAQNSSDSDPTLLGIAHLKINPSKYLLTFRIPNEPFRLVFSETYSDKWEIYLKDKKSAGIFAGLYKRLVGDERPFETLNKDPLFKDSHEKINSYANTWVIEPSELGVRGEEVSLIVEFKLQKSHYIWNLVSFVSFIGVVLYLCFTVVTKLRKRLNEKR